MPTPSPEIIPIVMTLAVAFTVPTFTKSMVLLYGTILAPERRTVTAALRAMGLADEKHFSNYHRVLNRDRWSPWVAQCSPLDFVSKLLLGLIIRLCLSTDEPLLLALDPVQSTGLGETLERRRGPQIKYKSWFRDPIRSTAQRVSLALGIRWICLAVLVPLPWSKRLWALPFTQYTVKCALHFAERTGSVWSHVCGAGNRSAKSCSSGMVVTPLWCWCNVVNG